MRAELDGVGGGGDAVAGRQHPVGVDQGAGAEAGAADDDHGQPRELRKVG